jgi:hypothetical protein
VPRKTHKKPCTFSECSEFEFSPVGTFKHPLRRRGMGRRGRRSTPAQIGERLFGGALLLLDL